MDVSSPNPSTDLLRFAAALLLVGLPSSCVHVNDSAGKELWIPPDADADRLLEGRELWIDVELSGYTRQELERFSDYEAAHDDHPPGVQK